MEHRTTRPQATLRACRIRRLVVIALSVLAWLSLAPVLAQTGSGSTTKVAPERPDGCVGQTREPRDPDRQPRVVPDVTTSSQADQHAARQDREPSPQAFNRETASDRQRDSGPSR